MLARWAVCTALSTLLLATGCRDANRVVALDLPPHRVEGVYSVTGDGRVEIHWRANQDDDIDFYKVYRNTSATGTFHLIGTPSGTSYVDHSVVNGSTYFYAVAAVDRAGQESVELSYENVFDTPRPEGFDVTLSSARVADATSGWDFSAQVRRSSLDPAADIYYDADVTGGHYLVFAALGTLIQDAGFVDLVDVDYAPLSGWSADGVVEAIPGHSYMLFTGNNHYAKFHVTSRDGSGMLMDWAYQIDPDNRELVRRLP
ncbi:MAG TPA: hypothetical protein VID50_00040 [Candidatus Eisenbacteria bacterium]|jgi:hypothetical protein